MADGKDRRSGTSTDVMLARNGGGKENGMTSPIPYEMFEERAADQRRQLHNSVIELRHAVRDRLDVRRAARQYVWPASGVAVLLGLVVGYGFGGIFSSD
jgi:hypothetical protein